MEENLKLGAYTLNDPPKTDQNLAYVYELFPIFKMRPKQSGGTLSGGEQQMLAIGRGLMSNPKMLMLNEPSLGLMPKLVDEMLEAVSKLKDAGKTILLVEQNVRGIGNGRSGLCFADQPAHSQGNGKRSSENRYR